MSSSAQVVSVTSGKGGVGKTLTTVNLAVSARRMGRSVLILDGDLGLANVDVVLGLKTDKTVRDVLDGQARIADIILEAPLGVKVIPSGSGIGSLTSLNAAQREHLLDEIESLEENFDTLIIDTGAGISESVMHFNAAADRTLVVTTPEPHAMTDAYALIKVMAEDFGRKRFDLLINQTRSEQEGLKIFDRISEVANRFLGLSLDYAGPVPLDPQVSKSVMQRRAASEGSTFTNAGQAWNKIARDLFHAAPGRRQDSDFWQDLLLNEPVSVSSAVG